VKRAGSCWARLIVLGKKIDSVYQATSAGMVCTTGQALLKLHL
jgi:threonine/homoserine efflux transporter RhtA